MVTLKTNVMVIRVIEYNYLVQVKLLFSVNGAISIVFNLLTIWKAQLALTSAHKQVFGQVLQSDKLCWLFVDV